MKKKAAARLQATLQHCTLGFFKNVVLRAAHGDDRKARGNQGSRSRTCEAGESKKEREK
jgi:hypothetical protein